MALAMMVPVTHATTWWLLAHGALKRWAYVHDRAMFCSLVAAGPRAGAGRMWAEMQPAEDGELVVSVFRYDIGGGQFLRLPVNYEAEP